MRRAGRSSDPDRLARMVLGRCLTVRPGEAVTIESEWGTRTGTIVEMPFVDPDKTIPVS